MKTLMVPLILTLLCAGFAAFAADSGAMAEVKAAHQELVKAAHAGDAAALGRLLADGLQYSHSSAKVESKQQAIDAMVKTKPNFEVHSETIHVYGNTATIRAKITAHNMTDGKATDIPLSMLMVWVKNGGHWQLVERQTTRPPA